MTGRTVALEVGPVTAADLIEALRGQPPATEAEARRRQALADQLSDALFTTLATRKDTA